MLILVRARKGASWQGGIRVGVSSVRDCGARAAVTTIGSIMALDSARAVPAQTAQHATAARNFAALKGDIASSLSARPRAA